MDVSGKTDVGKKRDHNEDSIIIDDRRNIFIVADGMGGHRAGEMASKMAVEVAYDYLVSTEKPTNTDKEIINLLSSALLKAHKVIKLSAKLDFAFRGMGTTLVILTIRDNKAYFCHVGDSRGYLIRNKIKQITKDQTLGNYLIDHKKKSPEEIPSKAWHTITQAVGVSEKITPQSNIVEIELGDILLICSDGLTDMLTDSEIENVVMKYKDNNFNDITTHLVNVANHKGGKDNISVIVVRCVYPENQFWHTSLTKL